MKGEISTIQPLGSGEMWKSSQNAQRVN